MKIHKTPAVYFRCDAGPGYGLGHLMRCVSLAQGFQRADINEIFFLVRRCGYDNLYRNVLTNNGLRYIMLPDSAKGLRFEFDRYTNKYNFNIAIFDNYDVTAEQMFLFKKKHDNLIAIDDLADRDFYVDMIVNQNIDAGRLSYRTLLPAKLLLGTSYVLLRNNVLLSKEQITARQNRKRPRIYMSFGGGDVYSRLKRFFKMLYRIDRIIESEITIDFTYMDNRERMKEIAGDLSGLKKISINMIAGNYHPESIMKEADFAVTAAGASVFEMAYLGVPQIVFIIDKNQEVTGQKVNETGFGTCLGHMGDVSESEFTKIFSEFISNKELRDDMSRKGQEFIDGKGAERVVSRILDYYSLSAQSCPVPVMSHI